MQKNFQFFKSLVLIYFGSIFCISITYAQSCNCDLTGLVCDALCCCDPQCTQADIETFQCTNDTLNSDTLYCNTQLIYANNLQSTTTQTQDGVLCIVTDNYAERNYYTTPTLLNSSTEFDTVSAAYPSYNYDMTIVQGQPTNSYYVSGDAVQIILDEVQQDFPIPTQGPSNMCIDNVVLYLNEQDTSCSRKITTTTCASGSYFDANLYTSFTIYQNPPDNSTTTVAVTTCDSSTLPTINAGTTICENAVSLVNYKITYNGTSGIQSVCVDILTSNYTFETLATQVFTVQFVALSTSNQTADTRSGNPGYLVGAPLRTSLFDSSTNSLVLTPDLLTLIDMPSTNPTFDCSLVKSSGISFMRDMKSGCVINVPRTHNCTQLRTEICNALQPAANLPDIRLATYGNITVDNITNWLEIVTSEGTCQNTDENTVIEGCASLHTGINYEILFANTGAFYDPQPKIVGISYSYTTQELYKFQCIGLSCPDQQLEVSTSVTFVDTSSTPVSVMAQTPYWNVKLPTDFFYPFTSSP